MSNSNQPPTPPPPPYILQVTQDNPKNYEKLHYDKHIEFLKWMVGIAGGLIVLISGLAAYITFSSIHELKEEVRANMKDVQDDAKSSLAEIKTDIKDIRVESINTVQDARSEVNYQVSAMKEQIRGQIPVIKDEIESSALLAVHRSINEQFQDRNIKVLIETVADERLRGQVGNILDQKIKATTESLDQQTRAASTFMISLDQLRAGNRKGLNMLDSLKASTSSLTLREIADKLAKQKQADYQEWLDINWSVSDSDLYHVQLPDQIKYKNFNDLIVKIVETINISQNLNQVAINFLFLQRISNHYFELFNFKQVNDWFRNQYPSEKIELEKKFLQKSK